MALVPLTFQFDADAEAIAEAASRPTMRFVEVRSEKSLTRAMLFRKPRMVVAIALANKMTRGIWAMLSKGEDFAHGLGERTGVCEVADEDAAYAMATRMMKLKELCGMPK